MRKVLVTLLLLAIPPIVVFFAMSQPEEPPFPPSTEYPSRQIDPLIGMYEMAGHDRVLATYSARGGVVLFGLNGSRFSRADYLSSSITPTDKSGTYRWVPFDRALSERTLALDYENERVAGFSWDGGSARKIGANFTQREVRWTNGSVTLTGTVFLPRENRAGGAVIVHGSGWSDRDNLWYLHFVMALVDSGVAVLFPDKRGSGKSEGSWRTASITEFANDALQGRELLARLAGVATERIGLVGVSQGGSATAPKSTRLVDDLPWIVNLSGSNAKMRELLAHETYQNLRQMGVPRVFDFFMHPYAFAIAQRKRAQWWELNGDYDPYGDWQTSNVPVLVIYGREDEKDNVPVAASAERFDALDRDNVRVVIHEHVGHGLFDETTREILPEVMPSVVSWVTKHDPGDRPLSPHHLPASVRSDAPDGGDSATLLVK